ncbi:MAG: AAA family ATPase [Candidatus Lernaella stagnicola]|nr:AAA family ATPase [Candidatus Lernaella stagnicola]
MAGHVPLKEFSAAEDLAEFRAVFEKAASICKRMGHNLVSAGHIMAALLEEHGEHLVVDATREQLNDAQKRLLASLEKQELQIDEVSVHVDERVVAFLAEAVSKKIEAEQIARAFFAHFAGDYEHEIRDLKVSDAPPPQTEGPGTAETKVQPQPTEESKPERSDDGKEKVVEKAKEAKKKAKENVAKPPYTTIWDEAFVGEKDIIPIGREHLRQRLTWAVIQQNDPVVMAIGQPGIGRSSLIEGWARLAISGKIPVLSDYTFIALDTLKVLSEINKRVLGPADLVSTIHRVAEQENVIFIVDDFDLLVGLWAQPMTIDPVSCFKPYLQSGKMRAVFTITPQSYEQYFKSDPVFGRRLLPLYLDEFSEHDLGAVIADSVVRLEDYHGVTVPQDSIDCALKISGDSPRKERPPKAVLRLLDSACAQTRTAGATEVDAKSVHSAAQIFADMAHTQDITRLKELEAILSQWVLGQEEAVSAVAQRVRLTKQQLDLKPNRPDGVFMFLGPSGVGKTELAKALCQALHGDFQHLVRLDMSEYMSQHEYAKIIGAPPGYIGYGTEGHLTGPVSRLGHAVVLLDEIEKAHPDILKLLLQLFDEGVLTDGKGERVDFSNCVVIMTSNVGRELWGEGKRSVGFTRSVKPSEPDAHGVLEYLLKILPSEFVNRIDVLVPFKALPMNALYAIVRKMLNEEVVRWEQRGKLLSFEDDVVTALAESGYDPRLGARHVARNIERAVNQPISARACTEDWPDIQCMTIRVVDGEAIVEFNHE